MTNWKSLRDLTLARCKGYCEFCGFALPENFALHHRKLRSRGGKDTIDNLIALHHECHNLNTNSVHMNITKATKTGHIVPTHENPFEYPLQLSNGSTVILTIDGNYNEIERKDNGW